MKLKKFYAILFGLVFATTLSLTPVYAEEKHPMEHGTTSKAAVSEEVDTATNYDNDMSTQIYMYIPAPEVKNVPNMGDAGMNVNLLCVITIGLGLAYLGCSRYAYKQA